MIAGTGSGWRRSTRIGVSVVIAAHLCAVVAGPFAFATRSGPGVESPVASAVMSVFGPYSDLAFLNHGYFFFAPNPGPSTLVRYRVTFDDQQAPVEGEFPNRNVHWPRLLYHRHFMLSEQWNAQFVPSLPPPPVANDPLRLEDWSRQRGIYEAQKKSFEQHLSAVHGGGKVTLTRVEHRPPDPFEVFEEGKPLTDPLFYRDLPEEIGEPQERLPGGKP